MRAKLLRLMTPVKLLGYFILGTFFVVLEVLYFVQFLLILPSYAAKVIAVFVFMFFTFSVLCFALITALNKENLKALERHRTLVDNVSVGIYRNTPGPKGHFVEANPAIIAMFEAASREEFLKHNVSDFYQAPEQRKLFVAKIMKYGSVKGEELALTTLKGRKFVGAVTAVIKRDTSGVQYIDGFIEDITERKRAESILKTAQEDLENKVTERTHDLELAQKRAMDIAADLAKEKEVVEEAKAHDEAILNAIGEGLIVTDQNGIIIKVNKMFEELLGWTEKESIGQKITEMIPMENEFGMPMSFEQRMVSCVLTKTSSARDCSQEGDLYYVRKNKTRFPVSIFLSPVFLDEKIIGAVAVFHDTTKERALESAKSDFISLASHQLRTPLAATKWALDLFIEDKEGDEKYKERLNDLYLSNERLIQLVNSLLDISRIEAGKMLNKVAVNLLELADTTVNELKILGDKKNQKIIVTFAPEIKMVMIDPLLFHEVLKNLVGNAIDYGFEGTVITLSAQAKAHEYVLSVHNAGAIIPEDEWEKLFEKFFRGRGAREIKPTGSGLGLYIAKMVIEASGGRIWFESHPDTGTTFYFTVPK